MKYEGAIGRRLKNEPIQYITGEQEFYGLALRVRPGVLIPRPETEHLVEAVLMEMKREPEPRAGVRVVDIGAGSGAIAIALAKHLPDAEMTATDISAAALAVARENAERHGARIDFVESDLLAAVSGPFDVVVSNPPYVAESESASLHPQVRDYEPATALFAGEDGLAIYRRLIPQASGGLRENGLLALEIGHGQRDAVARLLADWNELRFIDDLQGIPRVVLARRPRSRLARDCNPASRQTA